MKFPTECFFLTAHCSYVTWTPLFRRYRQNLREMGSLQQIIAELEEEGSPDRAQVPPWDTVRILSVYYWDIIYILSVYYCLAPLPRC